MILFVDSEDPDQTAHLCSLIWDFAGDTWPKETFSLGRAHIISQHVVQYDDDDDDDLVFNISFNIN